MIKGPGLVVSASISLHLVMKISSWPHLDFASAWLTIITLDYRPTELARTLSAVRGRAALAERVVPLVGAANR
jgi:hypothetical protein